MSLKFTENRRTVNLSQNYMILTKKVWGRRIRKNLKSNFQDVYWAESTPLSIIVKL